MGIGAHFVRCMLVAGLLSACTVAAENPAVADNAAVENRGTGTDAWWSSLPREQWQRHERIGIGQEWFEVYRVLDGVYAIYEPGQFEEVISFLVVGDERALLFDTGLGIGDMSRVVAAITSLPVIVLNSHSHYDHVGGNHHFSEILGLDLPYTADNAAGSDAGALAEFIGPGWVWKPFPEGFDPGEYRTRPYEITRFVADGDIIDLGGRRLEVLATPGHAPDALCLLDRENRLMFTGDTFYLAALYTHLEGSDFAAYRRSAERLAALEDDVDRLLTAHNVPVASSHYLGALDAAFRAISAGTAGYVVTDGNREYDFGDFSVIVSGP